LPFLYIYSNLWQEYCITLYSISSM
jgi:hypothetical protein